MANYRIMTGAKLYYATITSGTVGTYTQIKGLNNIPDIGQAPNNVEATTFDDLTYNAYVTGLQDVDTLEFGYNLEDPSTTANINVVYGLKAATGDPIYSWKLEYANGITVVFKSKCRYTFVGGQAGDLAQFNLVLTPVDGFDISMPTTTGVKETKVIKD